MLEIFPLGTKCNSPVLTFYLFQWISAGGNFVPQGTFGLEVGLVGTMGVVVVLFPPYPSGSAALGQRLSLKQPAAFYRYGSPLPGLPLYKPGHGHCPPVLPLGFLPRFSQSHDGAEAFGAPFRAAAAEALTEVAGQYPEEWASLVAQREKNPPAIPEGWE